jgi:Mg2+-importing ATPase
MAAGSGDSQNSERIEEISLSQGEILRLPMESLFEKLGSSPSGLTSSEAARRLQVYGANEVEKKKKSATIVKFFRQFKNPLVLILMVAGAIAGFSGDVPTATIVYVMVFLSTGLMFYQENKAEQTAEKLKEKVATTATVLRDGVKQEVHLHDLVPGDVILLYGGDMISADARVINAKDLFVDQSALTGESFPVEKTPAVPKGDEIPSLSDWSNILFLGTSVVSGTASAIITTTGSSTEFGKIVKSIIKVAPETEFEKGLRRFGNLIMQVTFVLVIFVFLILALFRRDILESLLFAVALSVGLTPELLPMILTVNLSRGALRMSKKGVIIKKLSAIQNFGNMDVLCTDKTGTLTENKVSLMLHIDADGNENEKVLLFSYLNSSFQTGLPSPLDEAILAYRNIDVKEFEKIDEVPFDFTRKRVSVIMDRSGERFFITKGAPEEVGKVCTYYEENQLPLDLTPEVLGKIEQKFLDLSSEGFRVLSVAYKKVKEAKQTYSVKDESDMTFLGFVAFIDPPKESTKESLEMMRKSHVELKILTGDNERVTKYVCDQLGFEIKGIVLGRDIFEMNDVDLARVVEEANVFARVNPAQKNRIMNALKANKHVVGFIGDGINDAPSMKVADVSISVNNAVDVAKESADIILLEKDLTVLDQGILEGRKTFGNTMKYVLMAISSNFGNMFSAAGASLFLNFLPMLPVQILLNNFMYDMSELTITTDNVDTEYIEKPKRLDAPFIRSFMLAFGPVSSIFDFLTFFVMLYVFNAWNFPALFQTAWFVESLATQTFVVFLIRTRKVPFWRSLPSRPLVLSSLAIIGIAIIIPYTLLGKIFAFILLPPLFYVFLVIFIVAYLILVEFMLRFFYGRQGHRLESYA